MLSVITTYGIIDKSLFQAVSVTEFKFPYRITQDELLKLVLGPTGNLRAPTLRVGKKLVVGFNEEMYEAVFG